jgi:hypothetical protein
MDRKLEIGVIGMGDRALKRAQRAAHERGKRELL